MPNPYAVKIRPTFDEVRKDCVAQSRYMDRQRLSMPQPNGGCTQSTEETVCNSLKTFSTSPSTKNLRQQILDDLPEMIYYQKQCMTQGNDIACRLNSKLLQYFMQKEFLAKNEKDTPFREIPHLETENESVPTKGDEEPEKAETCAMKITKCPHTNRKHYAKNMCSSCYRKFGRNQLAWNCEHTDRLNYSVGMCQTCYLSDYHKKR